jgi:lysozyme
MGYINFNSNEIKVAKEAGLSREFVHRITDEEKLRLTMYKDAVGHKTIGFGHNIDADSHYHFGNKITEKQAYELLKKDLITKEKELSVLTKGKKLNQGQKEALIDVLFNVGYKKIQGSDLIEKIQKGQVTKAVSEFDYVGVNHKVNPTLCIRQINNMHDYSKNNPSPLAVKSMKKIEKMGVDFLEHEIKKETAWLDKLKLQTRKELYLQTTQPVIKKIDKKCKKDNFLFCNI